MKRKFVIANWKMQLNRAASESLAQEVVRLWAGQGAAAPNVEVVVCPAHIHLEPVHRLINGTPVDLGSQDAFWEDQGAYTGEISPVTLKELGCEYCIVGHSERRGFLNETDEMVNRKVSALLRHDLRPIICVGETREERAAGRRDAVVITQVKAALRDIRPAGTQFVVVAYEPRWVIGTGQAVAPEDAASMHRLIRETLLELFPADIVENQFAVVYGGSVDSKNFPGFLAVEDIHGALVGNASLKPAEFVRLCEQAADAAK